MESYKDKHKTEEWTVPVGCEWLGKESCLVFDGIIWTAGAKIHTNHM